MMYLSDEVRAMLDQNAERFARLWVREGMLDDLMKEYGIDAMLDRLNNACGTGWALNLSETQEIRSFVERLIQIHRKGEKSWQQTLQLR